MVLGDILSDTHRIACGLLTDFISPSGFVPQDVTFPLLTLPASFPSQGTLLLPDKEGMTGSFIKMINISIYRFLNVYTIL